MIKFLSEPYLGSVKNPQFIRYTRYKNMHLRHFGGLSNHTSAGSATIILMQSNDMYLLTFCNYLSCR